LYIHLIDGRAPPYAWPSSIMGQKQVSQRAFFRMSTNLDEHEGTI